VLYAIVVFLVLSYTFLSAIALVFRLLHIDKRGRKCQTR
jgi:hypothetical protein